MSNISNYNTPKYQNLANYFGITKIDNTNVVEVLSVLSVEPKKYSIGKDANKVTCFCGRKLKHYQYVHNNLNADKLFVGNACVQIFNRCSTTSIYSIDLRYFNKFVYRFSIGEFVKIEDWGEYTKECLMKYFEDISVINYNKLLETYKNYSDIISIIRESYNSIQLRKMFEVAEQAERERIAEELSIKQREEKEAIEKDAIQLHNMRQDCVNNQLIHKFKVKRLDHIFKEFRESPILITLINNYKKIEEDTIIKNNRKNMIVALKGVFITIKKLEERKRRRLERQRLRREAELFKIEIQPFMDKQEQRNAAIRLRRELAQKKSKKN
jgi:hypothetical protein